MRWRSAAWPVAAASILAVLAVLYAFPILDVGARTWVYEVLTAAVLVGATALCFARAARPDERRRLAWVALGLGMLAWSVGELGWMVAYFQGDVPFPHWTDVPYLLYFPLMAAGVLGLGWRRGNARQALLQGLDALLAVTCAFVVAWVLLLGDLAASAAGTPLEVAISLLYPLGDVLLLAAFALGAARMDRARAAFWPILASLAVLVVADAGYAYLTLKQGGYAAAWFDLGWTLGAAGIGWAALRPAGPFMVRSGPASPLEERVPLLLALPALVAVAAAFALQGSIPIVVQAAVLVGGATLLARQMLFLDRHVRLARTLAETQRLAGLARWSWDARRGRLLLDDAGPTVLGLSGHATEVAWGELQSLAHPDDRMALWATWNGLRSHGKPMDARFRVPAGPDAWRSVQMRGADGGGLHGSLQDVTAQVHLEASQAESARLAELNRFKTDFINTAAHELNTPLTTVRLALASLRRGNPDTDARTLKALERNVRRLSDLVHDVMQGARLEGDRLRLDRRPFDLARLAQETLEEHLPMAADAGIEMAADPSPPVPVVADPGRLHEVLMNLLTNALKHTPRGGRVRVVVAAHEGLARLEVADTGQGIPPQKLPLLFQPFSQASPPLPGRGEGSGLGLYICKGIVERHGGRIWVESAGPGHGARFVVEVPVHPPAQALPPSQPAPPAQPAAA